MTHILSGDLWGGSEAVTRDLLAELAREEGLALSAVVFNTGRLRDELEELGIPTVLVPEAESGLVGMTRRLRSALSRLRPDVVHSHGYKENIVALLAGVGTGSRHVKTLHGLDVDPLQRRTLAGFMGRLRVSGSVALGVVCSESFVAVSRDTAAHYPWAPRVTVIENGVDLERFRGFRRRRDPDDPRLVVSFLGRLVPVKGLDVLIEAFGRVASEHPDAVLQLLGEGPLRRQIEGWVEARGLGARVSLPGHCDDALARLADSDVFVLPSRHEGLPISLLESMALGVPVVASAVGGIPDVVTSGVDGLLVPADSAPSLAEALSRVLSSRELRTSLARAARATLEQRFSAKVMANQHAQLYRSLVARA